MSAIPNRQRVYRADGRLIINPTSLTVPADLDAVSPYGGTHLGIVYRVALEIEATYDEDHAEEYGETVQVYECGQRVRLVALLKEWSDAVLTTLHPSTAVGSSTSLRGVNYPGTWRAGAKVSTRAVKLLWVPVRADDHPAIYLPRALPMFAQQFAMRVGITQEIVQEVRFEGIRSATGCLYQVRHIKDTVL